jgi:hypothetical protein
MLRWRTGATEQRTAAGRDDSVRHPETAAGNQPCSALRCSSLVGMPCCYVDRRGRRCKTAWCPADRSVVDGKIYCALHAHAMQAIEWEFGAASHPDVDSRTVPILQWISSAAADEVIATLNVFCALNGEMLVAEPVRRRFNPVTHSRVWEKQWKTLSPTSVTIRVCISSDEDRPTEIRIQVNGHDVNVLPPPFNRELSAPTEADMQWLDQEVLSPISAGVARWMMRVADSKDLGYIPVGGGLEDVDASLVARPATQSSAAPAPQNDVDDAALDQVRRAHFLYGLEEIQAVADASAQAS